MSAFGGKRKARKITVQDEDESSPSIESLNPPPEAQEPALQPTFKSRKPSSLRKSIAINDETEDQDDGGAAVRIRGSPAVAAAKAKKRQPNSRLSFGPSETTVQDGGVQGDDDEESMILGRATETAEVSTPKASSRKNKTSNRLLPLGRFPLPRRSPDEEDDRPRYSKEYLTELQSATPNTPRDLSKLQITDEDEVSLDPSELEGAMIVDTTTPATTSLTIAASGGSTKVLTDSQIREKKERRARLAKQQPNGTEDFISLSDDDDDRSLRRANGDSYLTVLSRQSNSSKEHTRLVREDEDLGEGFDEFVEDGGLSLGRKAEREARRKQRAAMAEQIHAAEGTDGDGADNDSDSEAERLAAFEAAQTRAGMDGLAEERESQRRKQLGSDGVIPIPPRITPLPDLSVLVEAFKIRMAQKEADLNRVRARLDEIKAERKAIEEREPEVQKLLNEAGERYRALMMPTATNGAGGADEAGSEGGEGETRGGPDATRILVDQIMSGGPGTPGERGLESLGTTPLRQRPTQMEMEM